MGIGVMGRQSGTCEGFAYSEANKNAAIIWSDKHMFEYLVNPKKYILGTKMVFAGLKKESERSDLIAYLAEAKRLPISSLFQLMAWEFPVTDRLSIQILFCSNPWLRPLHGST